MPGKVSSQKVNPKAATLGSAFPLVRDIGSCSSWVHLEFPNNLQNPLQDRDGPLSLQIRIIVMENWRFMFSSPLEMFLLGWEGLFPLLPSSEFPSTHPQMSPALMEPGKCSRTSRPVLSKPSLSHFPSPCWRQPARNMGIKTHPKLEKHLPEHLLGKKSLGQCSAAQKCQEKADFPKDPTVLQPPRKSGES